MIACPVTLTVVLAALALHCLAFALAFRPAKIESMPSHVLTPDERAAQTQVLALRSVFRCLDTPTPPPCETQVLSDADAAWTCYLADCLDAADDAALLAPSGLGETPDVASLIADSLDAHAVSERYAALTEVG